MLAKLVARLLLLAAVAWFAGCSKPKFELTERAVVAESGGTITLGVKATDPPSGVRYLWFPRQGKCDPDNDARSSTQYTAPPIQGEDSVTVEVKDGDKTLFTDVIVIQVKPKAAASAGANASAAPDTTAGARASGQAAISITEVPPYSPTGGAPEPISGQVSGIELRNLQVVVYAFTDNWYVQPLVVAPKTDIEADGRWVTRSHLGSSYAALLVKSSYTPRSIISTLPKEGGEIIKVTTVTGRK
jgi:hypothetical protein